MSTLDTRTRWLALIVLCLGDLMIVLDTTIVNVALPSIRDGSGLLGDVARLGRQRVPADFRRLPAARRPARRPVRPPADVPGRNHALHARLARVRAGDDAGVPGRGARRAGARRRRGLRGRALADHDACSPSRRSARRRWASSASCWRAAAASACCSAAILTDTLDWHWIFLVNVPIGIAVVVLSLAAAAGARRTAAPARGSTSPARSRSRRR